MSTKTCTWTGFSGSKYNYFVHELPAGFEENQDGNYIFTKLIEDTHYPIYIGEGDLGKRISNSHHKAACILLKGATHVHEHLNPNQQNRTTEEDDLLANYPNAYAPAGCNVKLGG